MVTTCSLPLDGGGIRKGIISALPSREGRFWFDFINRET